jgi:hypothetical protein
VITARYALSHITQITEIMYEKKAIVNQVFMEAFWVLRDPYLNLYLTKRFSPHITKYTSLRHFAVRTMHSHMINKGPTNASNINLLAH